jgi:hypothetical protein
LGPDGPKMVKLSQITPKVVKTVFLRKQLFFQTKLFGGQILKKHLVFWTLFEKMTKNTKNTKNTGFWCFWCFMGGDP